MHSLKEHFQTTGSFHIPGSWKKQMRDLAMERKCEPSPLIVHVHSKCYTKTWFLKTPWTDEQTIWKKKTVEQVWPFVNPKPAQALFENRDVILEDRNKAEREGSGTHQEAI